MRRLACLGVAMATIAAGCSGDDDDSSSSTTSVAEAALSTPPPTEVTTSTSAESSTTEAAAEEPQPTSTSAESSTTEAAAEEPQSEEAQQIAQVVQTSMEADHLRAVIVKVTRATGRDRAGVRRVDGWRPRDHGHELPQRRRRVLVRSDLLMIFVDEGIVTLDDTIDQWMPTLPDADTVTLRMLTNQTTGYPDFETDPSWIAAFNANPFHIFTFQERLEYAFDRPLQFAPGANWSYAHTNFMILGEILA